MTLVAAQGQSDVRDRRYSWRLQPTKHVGQIIQELPDLSIGGIPHRVANGMGGWGTVTGVGGQVVVDNVRSHFEQLLRFAFPWTGLWISVVALSSEAGSPGFLYQRSRSGGNSWIKSFVRHAGRFQRHKRSPDDSTGSLISHCSQWSSLRIIQLSATF